jgi:protein TonB
MVAPKEDPPPAASAVAESRLPEAQPVPETVQSPPDASDATPSESGSSGSIVPVPQIEDPEYYPARLLDVLPKPLDDIALRFPESAAARDLSGTVTLLLLIDELGVVVDISVISAEPPGYFEEAAIESFRNVLFRPAQRNGRAVKSRLPVEVTFDARTDSAKP